MKVIEFEAPGGPEVMRIKEIPLPEPGRSQIRVKAHSIGVGIPDVLIRSGLYNWMPPLPCTPGTEMSGTVSAIGPGVDAISLGDRIYVSARERPHRGGCYAEEIVVQANEAISIPGSVDMEAVATLANYQVAWHLLWNMARIKSGDTILVYAAAGGVGSCIVELALIAGAKIIGVTSSEAKGNFVKKLGVSHVINRLEDDVNARVQEITQGHGVDFVFDPAGGPQTIEKAVALAPLGTLIVYGRLAGPLEGDFAHAIRDRMSDSIGIRSFSIHSFDNNKTSRMEATNALINLLDNQTLKPHIHARLPLSDARKAHEMLEGGNVMGKILLKPEFRSVTA